MNNEWKKKSTAIGDFYWRRQIGCYVMAVSYVWTEWKGTIYQYPIDGNSILFTGSGRSDEAVKSLLEERFKLYLESLIAKI